LKEFATPKNLGYGFHLHPVAQPLTFGYLLALGDGTSEVCIVIQMTGAKF
jgi:hypothetical protein